MRAPRAWVVCGVAEWRRQGRGRSGNKFAKTVSMGGVQERGHDLSRGLAEDKKGGGDGVNQGAVEG